MVEDDPKTMACLDGLLTPCPCLCVNRVLISMRLGGPGDK